MDAKLLAMGWTLVDVDGRVMLRLISPSHTTPGVLICSYWPTGMSSYNFRRIHGGLDEGEPDSLPMAVEQESNGYYRRRGGRTMFYIEARHATRTTHISVERDLRRGGDRAEWRWNDLGGFWERYWRSKGWQSVERILGEEREVTSGSQPTPPPRK